MIAVTPVLLLSAGAAALLLAGFTSLPRALYPRSEVASASVGGVFFGQLRGSVGSNDFLYLQSLVVLLMVTIGGILTVSGAFLGGMLLGPGLYILSKIIHIDGLTFLFAGLGAMTIARSPNGIVGQVSGAVDRFRRRPTPPDAGVEDVDVTEEEVGRVVAPVG